MKPETLILTALSLAVLLSSIAVYAEERITLRAQGKSLQTVIQELALEHDIEFGNSSLVGRERLDIEITDTLNNILSRLLKGYNHVVSFNKDGQIRSVTVISAKLTDSSFDESILPTGELMSEDN